MKRFAVISVLLLLFIFRLFLSFNAKHGDMYNNLDWGRATVLHGPAVVYDQSQKSWPHSWPNQPPGSLLWHAFSRITFTEVNRALWFLNANVSVFPSKIIWWWEFHGELVCIKLPSILADFVAAAAIYYIGKSHQKSSTGLAAAILYLINPAIWYDSSYWGQTDPIVAAFSIWSIALLLTGRLVLSPLLFGLSLITKASWAPLLPLYLVFWLKKYPRSLGFLLLVPLIMLAVAWPFHPQPDLIPWIIRLYLTRILPGESAFITVLAFNFWNLIYGPAFLPDTISFLGLPANLVGWGLVGGYLYFCLWRLWHNPGHSAFLYLTVMLFFAVFLFAPKMIHRYIFPVFPPLTALLIFYPGKLLWWALTVLTICFLVNTYYQWWAPGIPFLALLYTPLLTKLVSLVYLSVFAVLHVQKT